MDKTSGKIFSVRGGYDFVVNSGARANTYGTYRTRASAAAAALELGHKAEDASRGDGCTYLRRLTTIERVCAAIPGGANGGARSKIRAAYQSGGARAARNVILDIAWSGGTGEALLALLADECRADDDAEMTARGV